MESCLHDLARRAREGDVEAAAELVGLTYARVYAFLRRLAGQDEDAADLTQRTYQRAWGTLGNFAGRCSFASWLHGIAWRTYVDWLRAPRRTEPASDAWWEACPAPAPGPDVVVADADLAACAYAAVDRLGPDARVTVHLHYYQGLTLDETAGALGVATSTVKYRLRGALDTLRRALRERPVTP
ncbi:MAG: RNA polymerase sigma factor [Limisphaerales bacterium]